MVLKSSLEDLVSEKKRPDKNFPLSIAAYFFKISYICTP